MDPSAKTAYKKLETDQKYPEEVRKILEEQYNEKIDCGKKELEELSDKTGLTKGQISAWFQSERLKNGVRLYKRDMMTVEQRLFLESYYLITQKPSLEQKLVIARTIGKTKKQVENWFGSKRKAMGQCKRHRVRTKDLESGRIQSFSSDELFKTNVSSLNSPYNVDE